MTCSSKKKKGSDDEEREREPNGSAKKSQPVSWSLERTNRKTASEVSRGRGEVGKANVREARTDEAHRRR